MEESLEDASEIVLKSNNFIIQNISIIDKLMNVLYLELDKQDLNIKDMDMVGKCKIYSIEERINFVKEFYKNHNINFDIDELINDGTIGFSYDAYESEYPETQYEYEIGKLSRYIPDFGGHQGFENGKNLITIHNTGYAFDSIILIHEISHYRDQFDYSNEISDLFTETLAFVESNIAAKEILSLEEYKFYIIRQFLNLKYLISINHSLIDFMLIYKELGSISYDNYYMLFGSIDPDDYTKLLDTIFKTKEEFDVLTCARYVVSYLLVPFLLNKYEKDNNFFNIIQELHNDINNYTIDQILSKMGLSFDDEGDIINKENTKILVNNMHSFLSSVRVKGVTK